MSKVQKIKLAGIGKLLSKEKLIFVIGGDGCGSGSGSGGGSCEDDGGVLCVPCVSDGQCQYKPNLYCGTSSACPQYSSVCRRSLMC